MPEIAARSHVENIDIIIETALNKSRKKISDLDGIAATAGPGLVVCLHVGFNIGKAIAAFGNKIFFPIKNFLSIHGFRHCYRN